MMAAVREAGADQLAETQAHRRQGRAAGRRGRSPRRHPRRGRPRFDDVDNSTKLLKAAIRSLTKELVRHRIVADGLRIDGRGTADLRPLSAEVGVVPTAHGSGLFQRGETQVLNVTTLGMQRMDQMIDGISPEERKRYMHHYNFPPFSTGETGFMRGPKRREIGHGLLAERALFPLVPVAGGVPLHHPDRVRGPGLQRLDVDGIGVRLQPVAHGRRCAHQGAGGRYRHGPRARTRAST